MSRPTEAEAALEQLPEEGVAAREVVRHLRSYGPNARVAIVGRDYGALRRNVLDGPNGLFTLFRDDFSTPNSNLAQFNHTAGGQVEQFSTIDGTSRIRGHIFTLVWADFEGEMDEFDEKLTQQAQSALRTNNFVLSRAGIVLK